MIVLNFFFVFTLLFLTCFSLCMAIIKEKLIQNMGNYWWLYIYTPHSLVVK